MAGIWEGARGGGSAALLADGRLNRQHFEVEQPATGLSADQPAPALDQPHTAQHITRASRKTLISGCSYTQNNVETIMLYEMENNRVPNKPTAVFYLVLNRSTMTECESEICIKRLC